MNRIDSTFKSLRKQRKKAFIAFITAGDPNLKTTESLVLEFERKGVDIVELGVPFSDPLADGPTIQAASQRALKRNVTLSKILTTVRNIRRKSDIPIALMTYYNPVFHLGEEKFVKNAVKAGVDGIIIPDLPPDEALSLIKIAHKHGLDVIFFLAPTTDPIRRKRIIQASSGFIYYVSLTGVTGARTSLPSGIKENVRRARRLTNKPVCVGFGVSTASQVKSVAAMADGVIVGSAIIKAIQKNFGKKDIVKRVGRFVGNLSRGLK